MLSFQRWDTALPLLFINEPFEVNFALVLWIFESDLILDFLVLCLFPVSFEVLNYSLKFINTLTIFISHFIIVYVLLWVLTSLFHDFKTIQAVFASGTLMLMRLRILIRRHTTVPILKVRFIWS